MDSFGTIRKMPFPSVLQGKRTPPTARLMVIRRSLGKYFWSGSSLSLIGKLIENELGSQGQISDQFPYLIRKPIQKEPGSQIQISCQFPYKKQLESQSRKTPCSQKQISGQFPY